LDELTNYGYVPDLPDKLTHIRNQGIGAVLGIQHHIQLSKVYQDKDAQLLMTQPGTRVFFRPRDVESATRISRSLGNTTVTQRKVSPGSAIHEDERMRPLLDPSEVERLEKGKVIVLTPSSNPVVLETFGPIEHDGFCELAPPERDEIEVDEGLRSKFRYESETVDNDGISEEKPDTSDVSETGPYNNESDDDGLDWDRDLV
ncbi:MAG: type IV secretory system conjugative DNA transfer family protein, partial [Cyanobacteria bacterium HKST-UBA02]|nr:type IV secretory system conjugative DNA transfer family protein [Cyanobacteria bacterium HKST-UBA02]